MKRNTIKNAVIWAVLLVLSVIGFVATKSALFIIAMVVLVIAGCVWAAYYMHNYMNNLDTSSDFKIKARTSFVRLSTADAEGYMEKAKSAEAKECCRKVQEALRFADPMSTETLQDIEQQITSRMFSLGEAVSTDDINLIRSISEEVVSLVNDRERLCRAIK